MKSDRKVRYPNAFGNPRIDEICVFLPEPVSLHPNSVKSSNLFS